MEVYNPISDYIRRSAIPAVGDLVTRGATDPEAISPSTALEHLKSAGALTKPAFSAMSLLDTGIYLGNFSRGSSGSHVISGVGFQPAVVLFMAKVDAADQSFSLGWDDGSSPFSMRFNGNTGLTYYDATESIYVVRTGTDVLSAHITALGSDGFTLTWSLSGGVTVVCYFLALP